MRIEITLHDIEGLERKGPFCMFGHFEKIDFENFDYFEDTYRDILDKTYWQKTYLYLDKFSYECVEFLFKV